MGKLSLVQRDRPSIRVLLVEDDPSDAHVIGSLLNYSTKADYQSYHVRMQAEALAILAEQEFDVCLLDLTLPDTTGFSALIDIQEKAPDMPVLILTGLNNASLAKRAVGRGAQDYLLKDELETTDLMRSIDYAVERKRLEKGLFQRANYDSLTGLANREMFMNRLKLAQARAERLGTNIALLFIDLDRFKPINDVHGHDAGDEVLRIVAQRIKAVLRSYDTPARFGGDEFAVLLEGISNPQDAAMIAKKIIDTLGDSIPYQECELRIGASIGILFSSEPLPVDIMIQRADVAMYDAKREGGGTYRFLGSDMQSEAVEQLTMIQELHAALMADELRLYYQPYVTSDAKTVLGVEALLRWKHPVLGLLSAQEFLPRAEEARLMPEIAQWMCAQIRQDITLWNTDGMPPLTVAINLSASQLDAPGLVSWLTPLAQRELLGIHRLAVEVPEEALAFLTQPRFTLLSQLSDMGILLHLDHFGRSSFSLSALHSLPFSLMKLDMSLIKGMSNEASNDALIKTAIMLAHHLGMKAGAVGVELPWQAQALRTKACDVMQGHLTVQPMASDQLIQWLQNLSGG